MKSFLFVTEEVEFQEATPKGAKVLVTMLELGKTSQQGTEYKLSEGDTIAASLVGVPLYYGTDWKGKHDRKRSPVGKVLETFRKANKIKGLILVTAKNLISKLKKGVKFLFSVGGNADFIETIKKAGRFVRRMVGAKCNHLQIVDLGTTVGFPSAKIEKIVEFNETVIHKNSVMFIDYEIAPVERFISEAIQNGVDKAIGIIASRRFQ